MEHLTVTLDTAKKLKEAGFPQETVLSWDESDRPNDDGEYFAYVTLDRDVIFVPYAAPTAQEIADQLPRDFETFRKGNNYRAIGSNTNGFDSGTLDADTMAEALAQLWLKLQEAA